MPPSTDPDSAAEAPPTSRTLVLLRHGKSDWSGNHADIDRPLAGRGQRQAPETGRWLAAELDRIDLVVVSPATRARGTWDLVAAELGRPPRTRLDDRLYAATDDELLEVVRELPGDAATAVVVGHNPGLEDLAQLLTGEWVPLPTSAVAVIRLTGDWAGVGHKSGVLAAAGRPPTVRRLDPS